MARNLQLTKDALSVQVRLGNTMGQTLFYGAGMALGIFWAQCAQYSLGTWVGLWAASVMLFGVGEAVMARLYRPRGAD